uniref:CSON012069 protein n=1 Tax=Culicoides sonorensis TaxID=179676 RepID=A0A336KKS9_CULSO
MDNTIPSKSFLVWNDHDKFITRAFCEFLQKDSLTDISIVCSDKTIKAHKLLLSAASPFFHKIIESNPCKHPIMILHDYPSCIIEMILAYIYCGEINIPQAAVFVFIEVAKALEIKGLEHINEINSPQLSPSLQPRRKQPNPSRATEPEITGVLPLDFSLKSNGSIQAAEPPAKKQKSNETVYDNCIEESIVPCAIEKPNFTQDNQSEASVNENRDLPENLNHNEVITLPYPSHMKPFSEAVPLKGFSPQQSMKPPKKQKHNLNTSHGNHAAPISNEHSPEQNNENSIHNMLRQHQSARGGPPRSWTNQDLMNALDDVWSKRMNTSQAARYHRIPYNSLLMYVRGKYGKTLNIRHSIDSQQSPVSVKSLPSPPLQQQQMHQHEHQKEMQSNFMADEDKIRKLFSQSFPQQGCLPPHDLLHNFAVLSHVAAQHNIK